MEWFLQEFFSNTWLIEWFSHYAKEGLFPQIPGIRCLAVKRIRNMREKILQFKAPPPEEEFDRHLDKTPSRDLKF